MGNTVGGGQGGDDIPSALIMGDVVYFIHDSIQENKRSQLHRILKSMGAKLAASTIASPSSSADVRPEHSRFDVTTVTHVITDTLKFPEYEAVEREREQRLEKSKGDGFDQTHEELVQGPWTVIPSWVTRSFDLQVCEKPHHFSADPTMLFSGMNACLSELPQGDREAMQAVIEANGGQFSFALTKRVTHLFVISPSGLKYDAWLKHGRAHGIKCLLPHWLDDSMSLRTLVPYEPYLFPNPPILDFSSWGSEQAYEVRLGRQMKTRVENRSNPMVGEDKDPDKLTTTDRLVGPPKQASTCINRQLQAYFDSVNSGDLIEARISGGPNSSFTVADSLPSHGGPVDSVQQPASSVLEGHRVYLSSCLQLSPRVAATFKARIESAGGVCETNPVKEENGDLQGGPPSREEMVTRLKLCDVVVCSRRHGWEYWMAYEENKTIGNPTWLWHVLMTSKYDHPTDRLMHYPIPSYPVDGFRELEITLTNYLGNARDYLKKMIVEMGAKYNGGMGRNTTHIVAASRHGDKVAKAEVNTSLVNHFWLEDCFIHWKLLPIANERYTKFLPSVNYHQIVGETALPESAIAAWAARTEVRMARNECFLLPGESRVDEPEKAVREDKLTRTATWVSASGSPNGPRAAKRSERDISEARDNRSSYDVENTTDEPEPKRHRKQLGTIEQNMEVEVGAVKGAQKSRRPTQKTRAEPVARRSEPDRMVVDEDDGEDLPTIETVMSMGGASKSRASVIEPDDSAVSGVAGRPTGSLESSVRQVQQSLINSRSDRPSTGLALEDDDEDSDVVPVAGPSRIKLGKANRNSSATPKGRGNVEVQDQERVQVGRRSAAANAEKKLHEQVMPDVMKFQAEERSSSKKRIRELSRDDDEDRKAPKSKGGRGRQGSFGSDLEEVEGPPPAKVVKAVAALKGGGKSKPEKKVTLHPVAALKSLEKEGTFEDLSSFDAPPGQRKSTKPPPSIIAAEGKTVRILTTGVELNPSKKQMLTKLSAKFTDDPKSCTHLVAAKICRTEKFLCALSFAPMIVTEKWLNECITQGALVDEREYALQDPANEKKWGVRLSEALERAKKGKVFAGHTLYITSKVEPSYATLSKIVECGGGQVESKLPSVNRIIGDSEKRHIVSCEKDKAVWTSFSKAGIPIWSAEVLLVGALRQELNFDPERFRVD